MPSVEITEDRVGVNEGKDLSSNDKPHNTGTVVTVHM